MSNSSRAAADARIDRPGRACGLLLLAFAANSPARAAEALQNWFNDPFFQVTAAVADCPLPAGPYVSEPERRMQAHRRAEKGTTCWLAKECDRPNAYAYDPDIAAAFQTAWRERGPARNSTLWVTVQGRVVYVEGCAADASAVAAMEAFARSLPHVQQAIALVRTDPSARPPDRVRASP